MPRRKKNIKVEVYKPLEQNMEEFQNRVNRALTEMIEMRIEKAELERKRKSFLINELEQSYVRK